MVYGGFGIRLLAALIDGVATGVVIWLLAIPFAHLFGIDATQNFSETLFDKTPYGKMLNAQAFYDLLIFLCILLGLSTVLLGAYDAIFPATKLMGTPGKWVLGLAITDLEGKPITMGHSFKRHGAKALSASILVGFFWPLFMDNKQSLHDIIAKTLVVKRHSIR